MADDRTTSYHGPRVVIQEDEITHLCALLHAYPRPWNASLRERIRVALQMKEAKRGS